MCGIGTMPTACRPYLAVSATASTRPHCVVVAARGRFAPGLPRDRRPIVDLEQGIERPTPRSRRWVLLRRSSCARTRRPKHDQPPRADLFSRTVALDLTRVRFGVGSTRSRPAVFEAHAASHGFSREVLDMPRSICNS